MKKYTSISKDQLITILKNWSFGAQPASIQYLTTPEINKLGLDKYGIVFKLANVGVMLGYCYSNAVKKANESNTTNKTNLVDQKNSKLYQLAIENDFISQPIWKGKGKRINSVLVEHTETKKLFLSYKYQQTFKSYYFDNNLNRINNTDIISYLKGNNTPKPIIEHRELNIDNIKKLKFRGVTYIIN